MSKWASLGIRLGIAVLITVAGLWIFNEGLTVHADCKAGEKELCHGCCSCYLASDGLEAMRNYCECIPDDCEVVGPHELNCSGEQRWHS